MTVSRLTLANRLAALTMVTALAACVPQVEAPAPVAPPPAAAGMMVGGAAMQPAWTIAQNLGASRDHKTLAQAITAGGFGSTLGASGSYTLFAPTEAAFRQLPNGTVAALMDPRSRPELTRVVGYHVVPGARTRAQIAADARAAGGTVSYRTQQGQMVRVSVQGDAITLTDMNGRRARVTQADVTQANGTFHVIDTVLLPSG